MKIRCLLVVILTLTFWGCDDNTGSLGINMMSPEDHINGIVENYKTTSRSIVIDSIYAKTSTVYLGRYTDPLFGPFEASFLAQFTCPPDFKFPDKKEVPETGQKIRAELYFYYDTDPSTKKGYFGDSLAACKMDIYELNGILKEGDKDNYYTNIDPEKYYDKNKSPLISKVYSPVDASQSKGYRDSTALGFLDYPNMKVQLPEKIGENIYKSYYENPSDFTTPENFQKIFKGIYAKCADGEGAVVYIQRISLRIYFDKYMKSSSGKLDSLATVYATFSTSKEVIQTNLFNNTDLKKFETEGKFTYLKSPGGMFTEVALPIDKVINGNDPALPKAHKNDSINSVSLSFTCYNQPEDSEFRIPNNIIMVRKKDMYSFFENNQVPYDPKKPDKRNTTYVSAYSRNKYSFNNIANLVSTCINEKKKARGNMSDEEWERNGSKKWEESNPDWNKVVLVPVILTKDSKGKIIKVEHDLKMNSVKLKGGDPDKGGTPTDMKVIYSRFNK